tara:strand:+ start:3612 stop:4325 length:714 start_codon:yes stop_codon:yes gene_type:complete
MKKQIPDWTSSNILRSRGEELGLKYFPKIPTKRLIVNGLFYASIILGLQIILYSIIFSYSFLLSNKIKKLEPQSLESDNLTLLVNSSNKEINKIKNKNKEIAVKIFEQKSFYALMKELSNINLKSISLDQIALSKDVIKIKGKVPSASGLQKINSFILSLNNSVFIKKDSFKLLQLETKEISRNIGTINKKIKVTKFDIEGTINQDYNDISLDYLKELSALGISNRFKKVIDQGFDR